jgi:hypothetical protein
MGLYSKYRSAIKGFKTWVPVRKVRSVMIAGVVSIGSVWAAQLFWAVALGPGFVAAAQAVLLSAAAYLTSPGANEEIKSFTR